MKKPILFVLLILAANILSAQKKVEKAWGGPGFDGIFSNTATSDGGYILSGLTKTEGDTNGDILIAKTNSHGDTLWTMHYGGPLLEGGNGIIQTSDGGYMIAGHTESFGAGDCDAYCMKLDNEGNKKWFHTYGGKDDDVNFSALELKTGEFIWVGYTDNFGAKTRDMYLVKTDNKGDTIWTKHYGGDGIEYGYSIKQMSSGNFLVAGTSTSNVSGKFDGWLLCLKENGDTLWTRHYGGNNDSRFFSISNTHDGGFIVAGFTANTGAGKMDAWLVKLDEFGNTIWEKTYGKANDDVLYSVAQLPNGNFVATGYTKSTDTNGRVYVLTADSLGGFISGDEYGPATSSGHSIAVQGSNSFMVAGYTGFFAYANSDFYFLEIDNAATGINENKNDESSVRIFPNPFSNTATLLLPEKGNYENTSMEIINSQGQIVQKISPGSDKSISIHGENLPKGLYLYRYNSNNETVYTGRFIIQ